MNTKTFTLKLYSVLGLLYAGQWVLSQIWVLILIAMLVRVVGLAVLLYIQSQTEDVSKTPDYFLDLDDVDQTEETFIPIPDYFMGPNEDSEPLEASDSLSILDTMLLFSDSINLMSDLVADIWEVEDSIVGLLADQLPVEEAIELETELTTTIKPLLNVQSKSMNELKAMAKEFGFVLKRTTKKVELIDYLSVVLSDVEI